MKIKIEVRDEIKQIAEQIAAAGGRVFIVGGAVRDAVRGVEPKDVDIMIQGIWEKAARDIISQFGKISDADVISNAPVFISRIGDEDIEWAMARIEVDVAPGKSGFQFISHPDVSIQDDMIRRDFSIGAVAVDVISGEVFDFFGGIQDIKRGIIRHVSDAFSQSEERVIRAWSQSARFDFEIAPETIAVMRSMKPQFVNIPREQIWRHFEKAGKSPAAPEKFIEAMVACEWIEFFPEIHVDSAIRAMRGRKFGVESFFAAIMADMSFEQEIAFSERICSPKQVFKAAVEIKAFGPGGKPERWVEGRDIAHVVPSGKAMGHWVSWAWIRQINNIAVNKEENIKWVEKSVGE